MFNVMMLDYIVVVDDLDLFRRVAERLIKRTFPQVTVVQASDGQEGYDRIVELVNQGKRVGVFSDYQMPRMSGVDLYERLSRENRSVPMLIATSAPVDLKKDLKERRLTFPEDALIEKPYSNTEVQRILVKYFIGK